VCRADAVRDVHGKGINAFEAQVWLQCGACGTWRRIVTTYTAFTWEVKTFERDRRRICDQAQLLVVRRREHALLAFVAALEHDVVGADDFVALARSSRRGPTVP
jgi:hypothetical protein